MMQISDPHDRFFYPHHTPMKETYNITLAVVTLGGILSVSKHILPPVSMFGW